MTRLEGGYPRVLATVAASTLLAMLAYAGPLGNAVTLNAALGASAAGATWILASMSVGLAAALVTAGVVADRIGHRRVFVLGAAVFVAANLACAAAGTTVPFVAARIVAGIGAAGMIATGLGLVAAVSEHDGHRAKTAVWWSSSMGAGIALGPVLTGVLDPAGAWRAFYLLLAAAGAALGWAAMRIPPRAPQHPDRALDVLGFMLLTGALTTAVAAIVEVRAGAGVVAAVLGGAAVVLTTGLVASQRYGRGALVDPALFRRPRFLGATAAAFGTGVGVISAMSVACTFVVRGLGLSTLQAGALLALWSATSAGAALGFSRLATVLSGTTHLVGGLAGVAVGLLLMSGLSDGASPFRLVPGLLVAGVASGLLNTGLAREALASVPSSSAAMGSGVNNTARYVGSSLGITLAGVLASGAAGAVAGWNLIATSAAAASLACGAVVLLLARRTRESAAGRGAASARVSD
ncbi:MFS transporter [Tsukamurella sp. 1534]|uniref:MFS transporter n=1 Tax=Tsukamurella sp. 1534 TaxID=1151061 RepID=UPI000308194B|nr:MFS transporter [Tsukamurella sp. 1534]